MSRRLTTWLLAASVLLAAWAMWAVPPLAAGPAPNAGIVVSLSQNLDAPTVLQTLLVEPEQIEGRVASIGARLVAGSVYANVIQDQVAIGRGPPLLLLYMPLLGPADLTLTFHRYAPTELDRRLWRLYG